MCQKSCIDSIKVKVFITMLIITVSSANPIPTFPKSLELNITITANDIGGCMKTNFSNVIFFNIKVTGLCDHKIRDHQNGNVVTFSELQVSGEYKDSIHNDHKFSIYLPNIHIILKFDDSNKIVQVKEVIVPGEPKIHLNNEALVKCISECHSLLNKLTFEHAEKMLLTKQ